MDADTEAGLDGRGPCSLFTGYTNENVEDGRKKIKKKKKKRAQRRRSADEIWADGLMG